MKRKYYTAILFFVLSGMSLLADGKSPAAPKSSPLGPGGWAAGLYGDVMGRDYLATIGPSDVANTPKWSFESENPPVSVREAVRLAKKSLADTLGDLKGWNTGKITLDTLPEGYWVYEIEFDGPSYRVHKDDVGTFNSVMNIYVLMNGRAICPKPKN